MLSEKGVEGIIEIAREMQGHDLCKESSAKILKMFANAADVRPLARLKTQMGASIDYGKPACKIGFNCETDADGGFAIAGEACV